MSLRPKNADNFLDIFEFLIYRMSARSPLPDKSLIFQRSLKDS